MVGFEGLWAHNNFKNHYGPIDLQNPPYIFWTCLPLWGTFFVSCWDWMLKDWWILTDPNHLTTYVSPTTKTILKSHLVVSHIEKKSFWMKVIFVMVIQMVPKIEKEITWYGQSIVMRGEPMHPLTFCNMTHPITSGLYQPTTPLRWGCWCTMLQNFYFTSFSFVH